jgi:hypothetical protein
MRLSLEKGSYPVDDIQKYNIQKYGMSIQNNVHVNNSNIDFNHHIFVNIYSKTPVPAIRFDECSSFLCLEKDLGVRDC